MKANRIYTGIGLTGALALIFAATDALLEYEDHKQLEKEDRKYHLTQDNDHKEPVKLKLGEILALRQRAYLKRKWEYGLIKSSFNAAKQQ